MLLILNLETLSFETLFSSKSRVKVIKTLAINVELNISSIITQTRLNHARVESNLEFLKDVGLVQEKNYGRIRIFRFRLENKIAKYIKNLIKLIENN